MMSGCPKCTSRVDINGKLNKIALLLCALLVLFTSECHAVPRAIATTAYTLAILDNKGNATTSILQWSPTLNNTNYHLERLGAPFRLRLTVLPFHDLTRAVSNKEVDFVFTNTGHSAILGVEHHFVPIATIENVRLGFPTAVFGGTVFTHNGSGIETLEDCASPAHYNNLAAVSALSFGGYATQMRELVDLGVDIDPIIETITFTGNHEDSLRLCNERKKSCCFVRTDKFESNQISRPHIVNNLVQVSPKSGLEYSFFPFKISTQLYPEWMVSAQPYIDQKEMDVLTAILFSTRSHHQHAQHASFSRWMSAAEPHKVLECLYASKILDQPVSPSQDEGFPVWVISLLILVVAALCGLAGYFFQRHAKVAGAPKDTTKPFSAMFIGPKNLSHLWQASPDGVPEALEVFNDMVRRAKKASGCYECRHVDSFFLLVATDPAKLVNCAALVQRQVMHYDWSAILERHPVVRMDDSTSPTQRRRRQRSHKRDRSDSGVGSSRASVAENSVTTPAMSEKSRDNTSPSNSKGASSEHNSARRILKLEVAVGIQHGAGHIIYDKEHNTYDYSGSVVDDAAHVMDLCQGGQTLVVKAATEAIEQYALQINGTFDVFTERVLQGCNLKCELMQYNCSVGPLRFFEQPNEDEVVDSVMNALQECKGGLTQKRITVLCVNVVEFGATCVKQPRDKAANKYKEVCEIIDACVDSNRGHVHHSADGQFIITFNAAHPTAGHTYRAGICAAQIQADLVTVDAGPVLCGFDSGFAMCGMMPYFPSSSQKMKDANDKGMHPAVIGTVVQNAMLLAQLCAHYAKKDADVNCLTTSKKILDLSSTLHIQYIDVMEHIDRVFDPSATPSKPHLGVVAVHGPKKTDEGDCDEWLYELENHTSGDPFAKVNTIFECVLEQDFDEAKEQLATLISSSRSSSSSRSEREQQYYHCLLERILNATSVSAYVKEFSRLKSHTTFLPPSLPS